MFAVAVYGTTRSKQNTHHSPIEGPCHSYTPTLEITCRRNNNGPPTCTLWVQRALLQQLEVALHPQGDVNEVRRHGGHHRLIRLQGDLDVRWVPSSTTNRSNWLAAFSCVPFCDRSRSTKVGTLSAVGASRTTSACSSLIFVTLLGARLGGPAAKARPPQPANSPCAHPGLVWQYHQGEPP